MNHSVIKSASIYSAKLPAIGAMREHLAELSFTPLTENQLSCAGFENNQVTGELVTNLPGVGYVFVVRQDTKLIPTKIVNRKLKERVDALITSGLREKVTRKEKQAMKEQLIVEMASTAEYETTLVHALYDQNNELLYLNTTTKRPLKVVMHLLVKCMGSLKTQTIHIDDIKMGISNRLKDYLTDSAERPEALGPFSPLQFVKLKSADTAQEMVTFKGMDLNGERASDVVSLLEAGYQVEELELWHEPISFKLNSDFSLRAITMPDYDSDDDADDYAHHWRQCNAANLILLSKAITDLCTMMDYQAPAEEKAACEAVPADQYQLYQDAVEFVMESGRASISAIQRHFRIGYNRAAWLVEAMETRGIVSTPDSQGLRRVIAGGAA